MVVNYIKFSKQVENFDEKIKTIETATSNLGEKINSIEIKTNGFDNKINKLEKDMKGFNNRMSNMERKVDKIEKGYKASAASSMAASSLPQPYRPGQSGFVAGVGQYQNQTALAVGFSKISDNGKWIIKTAVSTNTNKEFGGQMGVGYFW